MEETTRQYISRILGYQKGKQPLKVLNSTPARIAKLLDRLPATRMRKTTRRRKWSIAEILAHLDESEIVLSFRLRMILGKNGTAIQAFDQNIWNKNSKKAYTDPRASFRLFREMRECNVRLLKSIPEKMWKNYGMHEERGRETIQRVTEMYAGHDINHMRQMEELAHAR